MPAEPGCAGFSPITRCFSGACPSLLPPSGVDPPRGTSARSFFSSLEAAPQARQRSRGFHRRRERSISVAGSEEKKKRQDRFRLSFFLSLPPPPPRFRDSPAAVTSLVLTVQHISPRAPWFLFPRGQLNQTLRLLRKPSASEGPGHVFTGSRRRWGPEPLTSHTAQLEMAGDTCCSPSFERHAPRSLPLALQSEFRPQQLALYQAEGAQNPANQSPSLSFGYQKNDRRRQAPSHTSWAASRRLKKASLR